MCVLECGLVFKPHSYIIRDASWPMTCLMEAGGLVH